MKLINASLLLCAITMSHTVAFAKTEVINIEKNGLSVQKAQGFGTFSKSIFSKIQFKGFQNSQAKGRPSLPVKTWLLVGQPSDITVDVKVQRSEVLRNVMPYPAQPQECRCADDRKLDFAFNTKAYFAKNREDNYTMKYLGTYKGQPITQLNVKLAHYDGTTKEVVLDTGVEVTHNTTEFNLEREELKNYLIIAPQALAAGLNDFVNYKRTQGYNVAIETLASPNNTTAAVAGLVQSYYANKLADFVMIIGDEKAVPMYQVDTSGSSKTPSDLKYFLMDGSDDLIPDVYASRIVASKADEVKSKLAKVIEFEQKTFTDKSGLKKIIGIASNEGNNPSDDEYVKNIENEFITNMNFTATHFYQEDKKSTPTELNKALSAGAVWMTYLGHGSGTSWPSMYTEYKSTDFKNIKNKNAVKPIVIDVACQNGRLIANQLGTSFMNVLGTTANDDFGAAAYYGGSVNISWHPPAVMATGIAKEHSKKNFAHLGQALLAGQIYLASEWDEAEDIMDNLEWYHLQGDPGMNIQF